MNGPNLSRLLSRGKRRLTVQPVTHPVAFVSRSCVNLSRYLSRDCHAGNPMRDATHTPPFRRGVVASRCPTLPLLADWPTP